MITRIAQRKRPRRPVFALVTAGAVASLLVASVALAISDAGSYNIMVADTSESLTADLGNATVTYIGSDDPEVGSSGTGLFDPFVRLQGGPSEEGYNTCSQASCGGDVSEFETKTGSWTKAILASAIPQIDCGGDLVGTDCWELFVDINEGNNAKHVSLNEVEVWLTTNPAITDYDTETETGFTGQAGTTQVYDFSGEILIHDVNQGSGRGDLLYLIPVQEFESNEYFVLYSEWGTSTGAPAPRKNFRSEGGFEEWKVRKAPNVSIVKTANPVGPVNAGTAIGFDITVSNTGAADATNVVITDDLPPGGGLDWSTSSAGCVISGVVGAEVLTCTFATLAAGASVTVTVTSPTTAADCGVVINRAFVAVDGTAVDDDDASVTIQCGALQITKTAKHADTDPETPTSANLVATFTVVDSAGNSHSITTDATGVGCAGGVTLGLTQSITETTPPTGYAAPTIANVIVASGTCVSGVMTGGTNVDVENTPLTDITWSVDSLVDGGTSTTVTCYDSAGVVIDGYPVVIDGDGDGTGTLPDLFPTDPLVTTVSCDFNVDP